MNNRQNYQTRNSNNAYNRNNYNKNDMNENAVTYQSLVNDPEAKKIVEEYRKNLIKDFTDSTDGTLENEKIVYVINLI